MSRWKVTTDSGRSEPADSGYESGKRWRELEAGGEAATVWRRSDKTNRWQKVNGRAYRREAAERNKKSRWVGPMSRWDR